MLRKGTSFFMLTAVEAFVSFGHNCSCGSVIQEFRNTSTPEDCDKECQKISSCKSFGIWSGPQAGSCSVFDAACSTCKPIESGSNEVFNMVPKDLQKKEENEKKDLKKKEENEKKTRDQDEAKHWKCDFSKKIADKFSFSLWVCQASESHLHHAPMQELLDIRTADECAEHCLALGPIGCKGITYSDTWQKCFLATSKMFILDASAYEGLCTGSRPYDHCTALLMNPLPSEEEIPQVPEWPIAGDIMQPHSVTCDPVKNFKNRVAQFRGQDWMSVGQCRNLCANYKPCDGAMHVGGTCVLFRDFTWGGTCFEEVHKHGKAIFLRNGNDDPTGGLQEAPTNLSPIHKTHSHGPQETDTRQSDKLLIGIAAILFLVVVVFMAKCLKRRRTSHIIDVECEEMDDRI